MTPEEAALIIEAAGGDTAFAALLGINDRPGFLQRVNNWKRRGIPPAVVLEHFAVINALRAKIKPADQSKQAGA